MIIHRQLIADENKTSEVRDSEFDEQMLLMGIRQPSTGGFRQSEIIGRSSSICTEREGQTKAPYLQLSCDLLNLYIYFY